MDGKTIIHSKKDILKFYQESAVSRRELLIGIEVEQSGVYSENLSPVPYSGKNGYLAILKKLVSEMGWKVVKEEDGNIVSLKRGESYLHIE